MGTENNTACAITGHRPTRFKWKYNENDNNCKRLKRRLKEQLAALYDQGVRRFYIGGALGVDMWSGELLAELKEQPEYGEIELVLVLPFVGYDRDWNPGSKHRLSILRQRSAGVISSSPLGHHADGELRPEEGTAYHPDPPGFGRGIL